MLEHTQIIEFYKTYIGHENLQNLHGSGQSFRFACNDEGQLAVYSLHHIGSRCIYNDAFQKCIDRTVQYDRDALLQLGMDIRSVYTKNGGTLKDPMVWLSAYTNRNQDLCVSMIPSEDLFPGVEKKILFVTGRYSVKDCAGQLVRGIA